MINTTLCYSATSGSSVADYDKLRRVDMGNVGLDEFLTKELHFFLGTTLEWHFRARNPWVIIGVLPIPHDNRLSLF